MEQATNQFTQGLQMDTHPMVQGNNTLTDCLNGTLVTMNGNEVVLQNDMGNRKIDKAFLPSGYEPVGIKEYGGIIYVAAYNPITNKSQIGSFPSPQTVFSDNDGYECKVDLNKFKESFTEENNIEFQKHFSLLFPFQNESGENIILHSGDKFAIYKIKNDQNQTEDLEEDLFTNYDNYDDNKLKSPKNRKYTLSVGVLNSQNEFVDFTSSLLRWENDGNNSTIISFDNNTPDYIKFNRGYFITEEPEQEQSSNESTDDQELNIERNKSAENTYAYKLTGPLYIKVDFNTIQNLTYNVYGSKDNTDNTIKLYIETTYEYNCPDFNHENDEDDDSTSEPLIENENNENNENDENNDDSTSGPFIKNGDDKYESYEEYNIEKITEQYIKSNIYYINNSTDSTNTDEISDNPISDETSTDSTNTDNPTSDDTDDIISNDSTSDDSNDSNDSTSNNPISDDKILTNPVYNPESNTYKVKKLCTIDNISFNKNDIINLSIIPQTINNLGIKNLSYTDTIEVSKLNSNELDISDFRYYNNLESQMTLIDLGFKSYPEYGHSFQNLQFKIIKGSDTIKTFDWGDGGYNGVKTFTWNWDDLDEGANVSIDDIKSHILKIEVSYDEYDKNSDNTNPTKTIDRYLMTTKLFNDKYSINSEDYERDFGNLNNTTVEVSLKQVKHIGESVQYETKNESPFKNSSNEEIETWLDTIKSKNGIVVNEFILDEDLYPEEVRTTINIEYINEPNDPIVPIVETTLLYNDNNNLFLHYDQDHSEYDIYNQNNDVATIIINDDILTLNFNEHFRGREKFNISNLSQHYININNLFISFYDALTSNNYSNLHPYATINAISKNYHNDYTSEYKYGIGFTYQDANQNIVEFKAISDNTFPYKNNNTRDSGKFVIGGTLNDSFPLLKRSLYFSNYADDISQIIENSGFPTNKFFFVGTNNNFLQICYNKNNNSFINKPGQETSNLKTFSIFADDYPYNNDNTRHYWQTFPRPILFWMKNADGHWSILPIRPFTKDGSTGDDKSNGGYDLDNGWLGKYAMTSESINTNVNKNDTSVRNGFVDGTYNNGSIIAGKLKTILDKDIADYLKNRFKEFYYIGEHNYQYQTYGISTSSITETISEENIFNLKIKIPSSKITISNNNTTNNLVNKIFGSECIIDKNFIITENNNDYVVLVNENIKFQKDTEKFEELQDDFLNTFNSIDYALLDGDTIKIYDDNNLKFNPGLLYIKNGEKIEKLENFPVSYDNGQLAIPAQKGNCGIYRMYATCGMDSYEETDGSEDQVSLIFGEDTDNHQIDIIPSELLKN